jgi:hypothetical protein
MFNKLKTAMVVRQVLAFFGEVPSSIRDHLNVDEIVRITVAALLAGGGIGGVMAELVTNLPALISPTDLGLATASIAAILEIARRLGHGITLKVPPVQAPSMPYYRTA